MSLHIGRAGFTTEELIQVGLGRTGPDTATLGGYILADTIDEALVISQQLRGHFDNPLEPWVAIYNDDDETMGGYAQLTGPPKVDAFPSSQSMDGHLFRWSADVRYVPNSQTPTIESYTYGGLRIGGSASGVAVIGVPDAAKAIQHTGFPGDGYISRIGPGPTAPVSAGFVTAQTVRAYIDNDYDDNTSTYQLPVNHAYDMACTLMVDGEVVTGQHIPSRSQTGAALGTWVLSNGLLRVSKGTAGGLIRCYQPTSAGQQWSDINLGSSMWMEFLPTVFLDGAFRDITSYVDGPIVIRNTAHEIALRLITEVTSTGNTYRVPFDMILRRGSRLLDVAPSNVASRRWGFRAEDPNSSTWATSGTQAVQQNANMVDGNRWAVISKTTSTLDATNRGISYASATGASEPFAVGSVFAGSGAQTGDAIADLILQWSMPITEFPRVVGA